MASIVQTINKCEIEYNERLDKIKKLIIAIKKILNNLIELYKKEQESNEQNKIEFYLPEFVNDMILLIRINNGKKHKVI